MFREDLLPPASRYKIRVGLYRRKFQKYVKGDYKSFTLPARNYHVAHDLHISWANASSHIT